MKAQMLLLGRRIAAYLVDLVILFAVLAPAGLLVQRLLGLEPRTGPEVARTLLWNFSVPAWLYFMMGDHSVAGATPGKRMLKLRVMDTTGGRVSIGRALLRTAIKLLPWELVHLSAFALSTDLRKFSPVQVLGVGGANLLVVIYLAVAVATRGQRSIHDFVAGTIIRSLIAVGSTETST